MRYKHLVYGCRGFLALLVLGGYGAMWYFSPVAAAITLGCILLTAIMIIAMDS